MMDRAARKSAKSLYYHKTKTNRLYKVPPVAARRALYDKIYRKTEDGRYIIDGRPSCHSQSVSQSVSDPPYHQFCKRTASYGPTANSDGASANGLGTISAHLRSKTSVCHQ